MKITGVRVEISKTVSDGHYGNERYNAQYIAELDEGEDPDEVIRILSQRGRQNVIGQLAESESASIRHAIAPPRDIRLGQDICPDCGSPNDNGDGALCEDCVAEHGSDASDNDSDYSF